MLAITFPSWSHTYKTALKKESVTSKTSTIVQQYVWFYVAYTAVFKRIWALETNLTKHVVEINANEHNFYEFWNLNTIDRSKKLKSGYTNYNKVTSIFFHHQ